MKKYDLIVIGGGSAGFAAAIQAHELGKTVLLVNTGTLGGTCVNVGCVPSKTLIRAAESLHRGKTNAFAGIHLNGDLTDFGALIHQKDELVSALRLEKYAKVLEAHERVDYIQGEATLETPTSLRVQDHVYETEKMVLATGSHPWQPDIPGLAQSMPLDSTSAFAIKQLPQSMLVLGGSYIGLEIAQMFARLGTRVTLLQRSRRILPAEDPDVTDVLTQYLRAEGITIETSVQIKSVLREGSSRTVTALIGERTQTFTAEQLLCATGRRANTHNLGLEKVGVRLTQEGNVWVDENLETSQPGIFAAGDVIGAPAFVYTAAYEGRLAAANALGHDRLKRDYRVVPWVIFADPQVAGVGLNEQEAAAAGISVDVATLELTHVPRALAARDTRGFIKLLRRSGTDELLGARILAPEGGELVMQAALAIRHGIGVSELASALYPYLTLSEGIKLCAQTFTKDVSKLSCCSA